jgi:hypothetical protein
MYSRKSGLVIGFHGCDKSVRDAVVNNRIKQLKPSENNYDWLGNGIYFWENDISRAYKYAVELSQKPHLSPGVINTPAVLGAVLDLGYCLDLLDSEHLKLVKSGYEYFVAICKKNHRPLPSNIAVEKEGDLLLRHLDCAVIETVHQYNRDAKGLAFDSVRGVFPEGKVLYPNAGFREKDHIQIAVRNPNCIKGFFIPREIEDEYPNP